MRIPHDLDAWRRAALAGTMCACAVAAAAQAPRLPSTAPPPADLVLGAGVDRTGALGGGDTHRFELDLAAGDLVVVVVEQRGVDLALTLLDPDGAPAIALDAMDDEYRPERLAALAPSTGRYVLALSSARPTGRGAYGLRVAAARPATDADRALVAGEHAFAEARRRRDVAKASTWPEALQLFETALAHFTSVDDAAGVMKTTLEIGVTENYMARPEAVDRARTAVAQARTAGEAAAEARALRLLGNILVARGDYGGAADALDQATAAAASIGHRNSEARGLNDGAIAHRRRGQIEHAVERYERALPLARATGDGTLEGNILNNLGVAYKTLGELERARELFEQAAAHRRAAGDTRSLYHALINLSNVHRLKRELDRAQTLAAEALAIADTSGDRVRQVGALNAIGQVEHARGRHAEALAFHERALSLARAVHDVNEEGIALRSLARDLHGLGRLDEAFAYIEESLALTRRTRWAMAEREDLGDLAAIERDRGRLAEAARHLEATLDLDEALRAGISSPELRASFVASDQDRYAAYLDVLDRLHRADPGAGHDAAALRVSERARARVLLDGLLEGGVDLREGVPPDLLERERAAQRQLNAASERLSGALAEGRAERVDALQARVEELTQESARVQADIRRQSPAYAELMRPEPLDARQIQEDVLDAETVLLEYALGDARSWLWAVTPDSIAMHPLPPRAEIEAAARAWYEQVVARAPRPGESDASYARRVLVADRQRAAAGRSLSDLLLGPVAAELHGRWRGRRLAVVPAGVLDILPFAALPLPTAALPLPTAALPLPPTSPPDGAGRRPASTTLVAERHEVVRLPSASVVAALRRDSRAPVTGALAVLADPVFERADPRVASADRPAAAAPPTPALLTRNALGQARVGRLPFSREEADAIAALVPPGAAFKATGFDATRDVALGPALRDYRIVHFATHGVFDSARPALSGLILSLVDRDGQYRNGYVRLHDIYNLRLNAELVVLSACDTALGREIRGEGLVGLARAFMYAGAPRLVASLWAVNDLATAELMTRFYRGMLQRKLRPAAALHAAQREMRASAQWRDPYYWAGFTLVGDWR